MQGQELLRSVEHYFQNAAITSRAHFLAWERYSRWNRFFGIPVVIMTALVGTAIFGTLQQTPELHWRILAGVISIFATVLAALQTYLNFSEQAEKHKEAGGSYAELRRKFNLLMIEMRLKGSDYDDQAISELKRIVAELNEVSKKCPSIPDKIYDTARNRLPPHLTAQSHSAGR